jgi:hypothetical protein
MLVQIQASSMSVRRQLTVKNHIKPPEIEMTRDEDHFSASKTSNFSASKNIKANGVLIASEVETLQIWPAGADKSVQNGSPQWRRGRGGVAIQDPVSNSAQFFPAQRVIVSYAAFSPAARGLLRSANRLCR